jgi:hypothetical protein
MNLFKGVILTMDIKYANLNYFFLVPDCGFLPDLFPIAGFLPDCGFLLD